MHRIDPSLINDRIIGFSPVKDSLLSENILPFHKVYDLHLFRRTACACYSFLAIGVSECCFA